MNVIGQIFRSIEQPKNRSRIMPVAFDKGGAERVTRLYRRDHLPENRCWLGAPGWCLAYR